LRVADNFAATFPTDTKPQLSKRRKLWVTLSGLSGGRKVSSFLAALPAEQRTHIETQPIEIENRHIQTLRTYPKKTADEIVDEFVKGFAVVPLGNQLCPDLA